LSIVALGTVASPQLVQQVAPKLADGSVIAFCPFAEQENVPCDSVPATALAGSPRRAASSTWLRDLLRRTIMVSASETTSAASTPASTNGEPKGKPKGRAALRRQKEKAKRAARASATPGASESESEVGLLLLASDQDLMLFGTECHDRYRRQERAVDAQARSARPR
jgi:hypothetical protein